MISVSENFLEESNRFFFLNKICPFQKKYHVYGNGDKSTIFIIILTIFLTSYSDEQLLLCLIITSDLYVCLYHSLISHLTMYFVI